MARIFLCHASEDKPQVREVYQRLKALGFEPWLDEEEILPGQDWDFEIETALEQSDFVMVFLSERSVRKIGYVQREFRRAMYHSKEMPEGYIHTIPIKLDDCTVPRRFSHHQWVNLNDEGAFDRIIRALHYGLKQRGDPIPEPLVFDAPSAIIEAGALPQPFTNSIGMEFVLIRAGKFLMGTPREQLDAIAGDDKDYRNRIENQTPQHQVEISRLFYMGKYPVTQAQWQVVMETNPSDIIGANRPLENVSWKDIFAFIEKLNEREGDSRHYRLPTEAEWEYACRATSNTLYYFGDDEAELGQYAWYGGSSDGQPQPVGQKRPNIWGLYDMHGNVWERVQDWYGPYKVDSVTDPIGPDAGAYRVIRGGAWSSPAQYVRAASRGWRDPGGHRGVGFRCAMSVPSK